MNGLLRKYISRRTREKLRQGLAFIGVLAAVGAAAYALWRFFAPDYFEGYDDTDYVDEEEESAE